MQILVTGGAGFIGSHLADRLIADGHNVVCIDDLSLGRFENIEHLSNNPNFQFIKVDMLDKTAYDEAFKKYRFDAVYHLAANSDIQEGAKFPHIDLEKTFITTYNTLELMKQYNVQQIIFSSSSAIYGMLNKPLSEDAGPLFPISFYGASKLCSEAFITAYCENTNLRAWIFRFPNVVGERLTHGVIFDFVNKLKQDPKKLQILGNGKQKKPYLYVKDLVDGIVFGWRNSKDKINCYNLGVDTSTSVNKIARIVVEVMGLNGVEFSYTGGDKGWLGDVPCFKYDLTKINKLGWKALRTSDDAVRLSVQNYLDKET